ncbi:MAG: GDP-mannose dehydrogenase [Deltaproteobacteria bacterium]|nr:GDP-mannose dehydrogenase [Deltaproteobacteria bacterium]
MTLRRPLSEGCTLVIGLGEIGRPLYELLRAKDARAVGVDLDRVEVPGDAGVMHVCYPYVLAPGFVPVTVQYAARYRPRLLVIHSTVRPGTTRAVAQQSGVPAVYSPIRGKHSRMREDLLRYVKFVAGTDEKAVAAASAELNAAGMKTAAMASPEALELAKLLETSYFGLLIAWAQEMDRFAKQVGADYLDVARFFEEVDYLPRVVFQPGHIGGHCVMPNIDILDQAFDSPFFAAIRASNEQKAAELAATSGQRLEPFRVGKR